jgi:hypothetical protein
MPIVGFRPGVVSKSADVNDLPAKLSPHGGTSKRREIRVRNKQKVLRWDTFVPQSAQEAAVQNRLRWILSETEMLHQLTFQIDKQISKGIYVLNIYVINKCELRPGIEKGKC